MSSPHSPYVVFFLNQQFKVEDNPVSSQSALQNQLTRFLDFIHESSPDILREQAEVYLTRWSTGNTRWLRRYYDAEHAESVYQLTPHSEDVLTFLTEILDRPLGFVGTESRLTRIIDTLSDIVVRGSDDPKRRLGYLQAERSRIDDEIRSIEAGETVSTHSPTALRERFADVVSDLVSLQGDFRAVEESFRTITRDVQMQQTESAESRGEILAYALDAEDRLKEEDQGASFQAFVRLILSETQRDRLEGIIAQLDQMSELSQLDDGKRRISGMVSSLAAEAERVLRTTRRLSATLRRLLDSRSSTTRLRLASVLRGIMAAAARRAEEPPSTGIDVFTELDLLNVSQRTFWEAPVQFEDVEIVNEEPDDDDRLMAFRHLAELERLDWETMRSNVASLCGATEQFTLSQLIEHHPLKNGSIEVLGYLQLAHDDGHEVDEDSLQVIYIADADSNEGPRPFEIPRIVFHSNRLHSAEQGAAQ